MVIDHAALLLIPRCFPAVDKTTVLPFVCLSKFDLRAGFRMLIRDICYRQCSDFAHA
jgi:hypothetical protein